MRIFSYIYGWILSKVYVDASKKAFPILLETPGLGVKIVKRGNGKIIINGQLVIEKRGALGAIGRPIIEVYQDAELIINNKVIIGPNTHIIVGRGGRLVFGEKDESETSFSYGCKIVANNHVQVGSDCLFSWDILMMDSSMHSFNGETAGLPIIIGKHVWVTAKSIILKGVEIGEGSVIATGAVVTKSVPPRTLVGGNPAKVLRTDITWQG
ncbi:MAG: acetyltransferase [Pelosinus sp.]|nr:acetyltransferase [Pelosinus sp.]